MQTVIRSQSLQDATTVVHDHVLKALLLLFWTLCSWSFFITSSRLLETLCGGRVITATYCIGKYLVKMERGAGVERSSVETTETIASAQTRQLAFLRGFQSCGSERIMIDYLGYMVPSAATT